MASGLASRSATDAATPLPRVIPGSIRELNSQAELERFSFTQPIRGSRHPSQEGLLEVFAFPPLVQRERQGWGAPRIASIRLAELLLTAVLPVHVEFLARELCGRHLSGVPRTA
jgi:hypothetical protein